MSNDYTIENFWKHRLPISDISGATLVKGWSVEKQGLQSFMEAPLSLSGAFGEQHDPHQSSLIFVSAAGAVGKSTLARQVAFETGAIYVDLAKAEPVGANTVSGGLLKSGIISAWEREGTTLLIDGLDEARIRVTQAAFEAFLHDIANLSRNRARPIVLFGRTGAIQDAWLLLVDQAPTLSVLEIGYYGPDRAIDFAEARLRSLKPNVSSASAERHALTLIVSKLREQTETDGDRFAGYAPVLQAVADRVVAEKNPKALVAALEGGAEPVTLKTVVSAILERERGKLEPIEFEEINLKQRLYSPSEQLARLVAQRYQLPPPPLPPMSPNDAQVYSSALETWVAEHPFLDGGTGASSTVFDGVMVVHALRNGKAAEPALLRELAKGAAANPFLSEFYISDSVTDSATSVPPEHIGVIYATLRARLAPGDTASLNVVGSEEEPDDVDSLRAEVEMTVSRFGVQKPRLLHFQTEQTEKLCLGFHLEDIDISAPYASVEIAYGTEGVLVAPINIQCDALTMNVDRIVIENNSDQENSSVHLEANSFDGQRITSIPMLRGNVNFSLSWPGSEAHPWTAFATPGYMADDPRIDEALRRLRKLVIAFRSHSKGSLARFRDKIEHARMTKGNGQAVLDELIAEDVLALKGAMYFLDPVQLAKRTGCTYSDCMSRKFKPEAIEFAKRALGVG